MQREIKFRGKRNYDGLWVYGSLITWPDGECSIVVKDSETTGNIFPVIPGTVGQLVGLKDKNGKEIFEGDIIDVTRLFGFHLELLNEWKDIHGLPSINDIGSLFTGIVVFDVKKGLMLKRLDNNYMEPIFNRNQKQSCFLDMTTCEISGSIHDVNPPQGAALNTMITDPGKKQEQESPEAETQVAEGQVAEEATQPEGGDQPE